MRAPHFQRGATSIPADDLNFLSRFAEAMSRMSIVGGRIRAVGGNVTLTIDPQRGGRPARREIHPWQVIRVNPYEFRLRPGFVQFFGTETLSPSNMNAVITCPTNQHDGYFYWLKATLSDATIPKPTALVIEHGATLPTGQGGDPDSGALPTETFFPLGYVTSTDTGIDSENPIVKTILTLSIVVQDVGCDTQTRGLVWGVVGHDPA